jgi:hypothetical protein
MRLNPARADFELRRLVNAQAEMRRMQERLDTDSHTSAPTTGQTVGYTVSLGADPDVIVVDFTASDGLDYLSMQPSTLMIPDLSDPDVLNFPTL